MRAKRFAIGPTTIRTNRGQPRHSQFYPQSIRSIISLGNGPKGGLRGAIRKTRVPKGVRIDSHELFVIRATSANDSGGLPNVPFLVFLDFLAFFLLQGTPCFW